MLQAHPGGPAGLIRPEQDGLLIPINDPRSLALAARRLILDAGLRRKLAEAGTARIRDEFSATSVVAQWRALLQPYGVA